MLADLYVDAIIYLRILSDGEVVWKEVGDLYQHMAFQTMESCRSYLEGYTAEDAVFIEETARAWWLEELGVEREDLRVDLDVDCFEREP